MIFKVTMKDPDGVQAAIMDAVADELFSHKHPSHDEAMMETIGDRIHEEVQDAVDKYFEYHEYLTVQIDTKKGTCVVVEG